jgi:large subunit ribosomal protein L6e
MRAGARIQRILLQNAHMEAALKKDCKADAAACAKKACETKAKLRASITPGTILILLEGKFSGKRVVFLKQLASGLLLVTGPSKYNGVSLQRVNQSYVIATSTRVDISSVRISDKITDDVFAGPSKRVKRARKAAFLPENASMEVEKPSELAAWQQEIDTALIQAIRKVPLLASYLRRPFSLRNGQAPHTLRF